MDHGNPEVIQAGQTLEYDPSLGPKEWADSVGLSSFVNQRTCSGHGGSYWYFKCKFGGRTRAHRNDTCKQYHCPAELICFAQPETRQITISYYNDEHMHETTKEFFDAWMRPSIEICQRITELTEQGRSVSDIRSLIGQPITPNIMYEIRRPILSSLRHTSQLLLEQTINKILKRWVVTRHRAPEDEGGDIVSLTFVARRFIGNPIAVDIVEMDDAMCTTINPETIHIGLTVIDANGKLQLVAFGITNGKEQHNFERFLIDVRESLGAVRVFVVDRNRAQQNAIESVFPESKLVFCRLHMERNVRQEFGTGPTAKAYREYIQRLISEDDYVARLAEIRDGVRDGKMKIQNLIDDLPHYSHRTMDALMLRGCATTNGIEGFNGVLRNRLNGRVVLDKLIETVDMIYQELVFQSVRVSRRLAILNYDGPRIGAQAVDIIMQEYDLAVSLHEKIMEGSVTEEEMDDINETACSCRAALTFGLPCRHKIQPLIALNGTLEPKMIPEIYFIRTGHVVKQPGGIKDVVLERAPIHQRWDYNSLMRRFGKIAELAHRNGTVRAETQRFFDCLDKLRVVPAGRATLRPSIMVNGSGHKKRKRSYQCSNCHAQGHNRATCPLLREILHQTTVTRQLNITQDDVNDDVIEASASEQTAEKIDRVRQLSVEQLEIYNQTEKIFQPFLGTIALQDGDPSASEVLIGVFMVQWPRIRMFIGSRYFVDRDDAIAKTYQVNFGRVITPEAKLVIDRFLDDLEAYPEVENKDDIEDREDDLL